MSLKPGYSGSRWKCGKLCPISNKVVKKGENGMSDLKKIGKMGCKVVRFQNEEMSDFKNGKKEGGKKVPLKYHRPEKDKIRGTVVRLLWRTAGPGLKPLRLPRAHLPHPRVNKTQQHPPPQKRSETRSVTLVGKISR